MIDDDDDPRPLADVDAVLDACGAWLGEIDVVAEHSWAHGESRVLEFGVADADTEPLVAKWCKRDELYRRERHAYRRFVPALGDRAPRLLYSDDDLRLLVMTKVPGAPATGSDATGIEVHRQAGALIRRLHGSSRSRVDGAYADRLLDRFDRWAERGVERGLIERRDAEATRTVVATVADAPPLPLVPTHQDSSPRNWMVHDGTVRLIDFGLVDWHPWVVDLLKPQRGEWRDAPELEAAFLDGYGSGPDDAHIAAMPALHAASAMFTLVWAREHGDTGFAESARAFLRVLLDNPVTG